MVIPELRIETSSIHGDVKKHMEWWRPKKPPDKTETMMKNSVKPSVIGTRSGYVIRFTCPNCHNENSIIYNMPKSYYKDSRDGTCAKCRKHFMVLTPGQN